MLFHNSSECYFIRASDNCNVKTLNWRYQCKST